MDTIFIFLIAFAIVVAIFFVIIRKANKKKPAPIPPEHLEPLDHIIPHLDDLP